VSALRRDGDSQMLQQALAFWDWLSQFVSGHHDDITALATVAIAAFTLTLWRATTKQARLTRASIDLARQEFLSSHRPELKIHSLRLLDFSSQPPPSEQPLRASFAVINAGTSACAVTGSAVYLEYLEQPDRPYLPELIRNDVIGPRRFEVGATDNAVTVQSDQYGGLVHLGAAETRKVLYLNGWVTYDDDAGSTRTTFFSRQYSHATERFTPVDDPECNCTY
jgi:hypothetical protein